ncbi:MAG: hypothetical protein M3P44_13480, partial [Actinomycetota bacterium]|nr:hypothetical protein [Actinomycetota bacterium]
MREALQAFVTAYADYLENPSPDPRSRVVRAMPEAGEALMAGGGGYTFTDPPAMGGMRQTDTGLGATAFLHEQRGWEEVHGQPTPLLVLRGIASADAVLAVEERKAVERLAVEEREAAKRRRSPLYWADRAFRAALMLPAYLVSVIAGESAGKIDRRSGAFHCVFLRSPRTALASTAPASCSAGGDFPANCDAGPHAPWIRRRSWH